MVNFPRFCITHNTSAAPGLDHDQPKVGPETLSRGRLVGHALPLVVDVSEAV